MEDSRYAAFGARLKDIMVRSDLDDADFNRLALELFRLQFERVAIYQELCLSRAVTPDNVTRWPDIPPLPTESFKEFEATSLAPEARTAVFYSSGTIAGDRSRHFHSVGSLEVYEQSLQPWFQRHFVPEPMEMSLLILTPPKKTAPNSSLAYMFDTIARSLPWETVDVAGRVTSEGAWEIDVDRALNALRAAKKPIALLGTAFSFVHLLDAMTEERLQLPDASRALETGGYKGRSRAMPKAELHQLISRRLGVTSNFVVSEYGMSELSSQAYDRVAGHDGGVFHFSSSALAQDGKRKTPPSCPATRS